MKRSYSRNLCHSAICLRGELHTSFQWWRAEPVHLEPPSSRRPITWRQKFRIMKESLMIVYECMVSVDVFLQVSLIDWQDELMRFFSIPHSSWLGPSPAGGTPGRPIPGPQHQREPPARRTHWRRDSRYAFWHGSSSWPLAGLQPAGTSSRTGLKI